MELLNFSKPLSRKLSDDFVFSEEKKVGSDDFDTIDYGRYENINGDIAAVFTFNGKNYANLDGKAIEITPDMSVDYFCAENIEDPSWIKLFRDGTEIATLEFVNGSPALINPFDGFEDWEAINFAWYVGEDIKKAIQQPGIPLYPRK
jgi:hypothetical protein